MRIGASAAIAVLGFLAGVTVMWWWGGEAPAGRSVLKAELYTCGMHPQVVQEGPGTCPICGMELTPRSGPDGTASPGTGTIHVESGIRQSIGVRTEIVGRRPLRRTVRSVAQVQPDEGREILVTSKASGWITQLFVAETGQEVRRGQRLYSIYSPAVVAGQEELLLATHEGNARLAQSARARLRQWDVRSSQIERILERGRAEKSLSYDAPMDGFVVEKRVTDGQWVEPASVLYRIQDLSLVWVIADIYEYEFPWIREGQAATLSIAYAPERSFVGRVAYVYPTIDERSRTARVRIEFDNPDLALRPGMFGTVRIETEIAEESLVVPSSAILRTGERNLVFVAEGRGHFSPVEVVVGREGDDGVVEVRRGLREGQRIVTSAQFLLDSESNLREALPLMVSPRSRPSSQPAQGPASRPASRPATGAASRPVTLPSESPASRPSEPVHDDDR
jgi:Cu(I)/Ag(I) efflux system membrane fusion protein/cobalt-zinc-cadmium efflux system membrane fusion protein